MENASKALLMAAGVLIGVMLITTFVYLFVNASGFSEEYYEQQLALEQQKEYIKFEQYNGRTDLTAQDVFTIINLVKEEKLGKSKNIQVIYKNTNKNITNENEEIDVFFENYSLTADNKVKLYTCTCDLENNKIEIKQNGSRKIGQ